MTVRPANPFVVQLLEGLVGLGRIDHVTYGVQPLFWKGESFDVIHFQWPEALFHWRLPRQEETALFSATLLEHKKRALIVTTVHNIDPHPAFGVQGEATLELVYGSTDDFIHLSEGARDLFEERYRATPWWRTARHHVIEHGDYVHYTRLRDNPALARLARKDDTTPLLLVFGALRSVDEEELARTAFQQAGLADTKLVFAGDPLSSTLAKGVVKAWNQDSDPAIVRYHKRVPDEQVAPLFKASRFLLLPRAGRINSGVIPLAFTFGIPVIAPDEVLSSAVKQVGGHIYKAGDAASAAAAIRAAFAMDETDYEALRQRIRDYARDRMQWPDIARQHYEVYRSGKAGDRLTDSLKSLRSLLGGRK